MAVDHGSIHKIWEQWYAEHGVPDSHKKTGSKFKWNRWWFKKGSR
jgi:hypothetical protein